jgi:hypothetical protein
VKEMEATLATKEHEMLQLRASAVTHAAMSLRGREAPGLPRAGASSDYVRELETTVESLKKQLLSQDKILEARTWFKRHAPVGGNNKRAGKQRQFRAPSPDQPVSRGIKMSRSVGCGQSVRLGSSFLGCGQVLMRRRAGDGCSRRRMLKAGGYFIEHTPEGGAHEVVVWLDAEAQTVRSMSDFAATDLPLPI